MTTAVAGIATRLGATVSVPVRVCVKAGPQASDAFRTVMRAHGERVMEERGGWFEEKVSEQLCRTYTFGGDAILVREAIGDAMRFIRRWSA